MQKTFFSLFWQFKFWGVILLLFIVFALIFRKKISKICSVKTTLLSLAISFFGGVGLTCFFICFFIVGWNAVYEHPIEYPFYIICGIISFFSFVAAIVFYIILKKRKFSAFGLIFDILTSIITLPFFFRMFLEVCNFLDGKAFYILPIT